MRGVAAAAGLLLAVMASLAAAGAALAQGVDQGRAVVGRAAPNSTARFVAHCEQPANFSFCDGYLLGAATTMTQPPLCLSDRYATERYRTDFIAWTKENPASVDLMTVLSVIRFLQERFACGNDRRT